MQTIERNAITHPFMQLVLECTFNQDKWNEFLRLWNDARNDRTKLDAVMEKYQLTSEDQLNALASEDISRINIEIVKEYSDIAAKSPTFSKPKADGDLVGSTALLLKDWPAHQ